MGVSPVMDLHMEMGGKRQVEHRTTPAHQMQLTAGVAMQTTYVLKGMGLPSATTLNVKNGAGLARLKPGSFAAPPIPMAWQ